ncbi:MAG: SET domain-containing protein-lysine N-methyltransferase [Woeseiaceae bacterium]
MPNNATGFRFQHSVEQTQDKGLGVFARESIKKGSVVWRHVPGAFLVFDEQSFGAKIELMQSDEVVYELLHVHAFEEFPGCLIRALDGGALINHTSDPNLSTRKSKVASLSLDVGSARYLDDVADELFDDRYSLVAIRDIEIGEELAYDYMTDDNFPPYYDALYEQYGISEDYLNDG